MARGFVDDHISTGEFAKHVRRPISWEEAGPGAGTPQGNKWGSKRFAGTFRGEAPDGTEVVMSFNLTVAGPRSGFVWPPDSRPNEFETPLPEYSRTHPDGIAPFTGTMTSNFTMRVGAVRFFAGASGYLCQQPGGGANFCTLGLHGNKLEPDSYLTGRFGLETAPSHAERDEYARLKNPILRIAGDLTKDEATGQITLLFPADEKTVRFRLTDFNTTGDVGLLGVGSNPQPRIRGGEKKIRDYLYETTVEQQRDTAIAYSQIAQGLTPGALGLLTPGALGLGLANGANGANGAGERGPISRYVVPGVVVAAGLGVGAYFLTR